MVQTRDYDAVIEELRRGADVNQCLSFRSAAMSALEHSVYNRDWRMAAIFILHGADPARNELLNGVPVLLRPSSRSSFNGLRFLVNYDDEVSLAYISLMETCHKRRINLYEDFSPFLKTLKTICGDWFDKEDLRRILQTDMSTMKSNGFSCAATRRKIEDRILCFAWGVLESIALADTMDVEQFMSEQATCIDAPGLVNEN